jgi:hypothetical protein
MKTILPTNERSNTMSDRYPLTPKSQAEKTREPKRLMQKKALPLGTEPKPTKPVRPIKGGLK